MHLQNKISKEKPLFHSYNPGKCSIYILKATITPKINEKNERFDKTKGFSYFSIQEIEQDPIKFMLQVKSMNQVPENLLKLTSFKEHLSK